VVSQRQLPTDLDYAVPTREYQLDQSSLITASAAADLVLVRQKRPAHLDPVTTYQFRVAGENEAAGAVIAAAAAFEEFGGPDTLSHRR
jgi:hypothetical protein